MSRVKPRKAYRLAAKQMAHAKDMQDRINKAADRAYAQGRADQNRDTCRWVSERTDEGSLVRDYRRFDVKEYVMQSVLPDHLPHYLPKMAWIEEERRKFLQSLCVPPEMLQVEEHNLRGFNVVRYTLRVAIKPKD